MDAELWIVGTPLDETQPLSAAAGEIVRGSAIVIGENRNVTSRYIRPYATDERHPEIYFLDPARDDEKAQIRERLVALNKNGERAVLLSDVGMPILFDPGAEVLEYARSIGFVIRCLPGPTSWGAACAVSGYQPPFHILGFLPREEADRNRRLKSAVALEGACVFMETPYRFRLLLKQLVESFGPKRDAFLAWEIAKSEEQYLWGELAELERQAEKRNLNKGEFILVTGPVKTLPKRRP